MTIDEILEDIRENAKNSADKGTKFETLILNYFLTEPNFANQIKHAWLWSDFPHKSDFGGHDIGIDVVCQTITDEYWAIQCKCYQKGTTIDKSAVDSFIATSAKTFTDGFVTKRFTRRYWVDSLSFALGSNAQIAMQNQNPPVQRLSLDNLRSSTVDWEKIYKGKNGKDAQQQKKDLRSHQKEAIQKATTHFCTNDRGKMIMACGSGKTFTSLRLAETLTNGKGKILFLVPSISLLSQTLMAWTADADEVISPICICSDTKVSSKKTTDDAGFVSVEELAEPATTDVEKIRALIRQKQDSNPDGMLVVFSTYQSIEVISNAQKQIGSDFIFDLIVCDEAHRTTGITLENEEESAFVRVHDNNFIKANKRLYMTATPRLYKTEDQDKAKEKNVYLCSMDDETLYGKEFYRLSFADAVKKDLLCDYKVIVLTMNRKNQQEIENATSNADGDTDDKENAASETLDEWQKLIGTAAALSKISLTDDATLYKDDPQLMKRAVAFCSNIKASNKIKNTFNKLNKDYADKFIKTDDAHQYVQIESRHVDGSMNAQVRNQEIQWLKDVPTETNDCRILCNVRCLSEGVDVPSLDAAIFLSPRKSQVEIVQSVGRVMRKSEGKKFGYLIIPVIVEPSKEADKALEKNKDFQIVWSVACALRSHDERFNLFVNNPDFDPDTGGNGGDKNPKNPKEPRGPIILDGDSFDFPQKELETQFYARMVQKVGDRRYWVQWAQDIALIAERHITQITNKVNTDKIAKDAFDKFTEGLHKNINNSITTQAAIEMLSQHIITKPVFEALFEGSDFIANNPISKSMQNILDIINIKSANQEEEETLHRFYESVKERASGVKTAEGRQKIIVELYDSFFKNAFPKMVEQLGIVYTPIEVVDFIINSVQSVLKTEFSRNITDKNINIIDPFTGTGTFIVRLLQSGLIHPEDFKRKYQEELRANEIVLLAYYIASVNIENAYHSVLNNDIYFNNEQKSYTPFSGICLTDTFQLAEDNNELFSEMFPVNSRRVQEQKETPIHIVIGNPPYSIGQKSANDNAQNLKYDKLDTKIESTYVAKSNAALNKSCYDSYIRAFRWATDRLDKNCGGIIAFVTNGAWLDNNGLDGFRKTIESEFEKIYVFNLRGNIRGRVGEAAKREGQNVFDIMTGVAITVLVKNPKYKGKSQIFYSDIGDYKNRREKLNILKKTVDVTNLDFKQITPNEAGDWLNKRNSCFLDYIAINPEKKFDKTAQSFFETYSLGIATNKDKLLYNFSQNELKQNVDVMVDFYNSERERIKKLPKEKDIKDLVQYDPTKIIWTDMFLHDVEKNIVYSYTEDEICDGMYRPFVKTKFLYHKQFIQRTYQQLSLFPTKKHTNLVILVGGLACRREGAIFITDTIPDLNNFDGGTQCFPLYYYTQDENTSPTLFDAISDERFTRHDGITNWVLGEARSRYGRSVEKEDIFYYVYGFLHSKDYRTTFEADLKKMLPRLPLVEKKEDFWAFSKAGRDLADLHLHYEEAEVASFVDVELNGELKDEYDYYKVEKIRFIKKDQKDTIIYNSHIQIKNIPQKAYRYIVNGKSAIEWILDRYCVTVDKDSLIKNDCNDYSKEHKNPRYILDLLLRIINISVKTVDIVESLPRLEFDTNKSEAETGAEAGTAGVDGADNANVVYPKVDENFGVLKVADSSGE